MRSLSLRFHRALTTRKLVTLALAVSLSAHLKPGGAQAAGFVVTPIIVEAGEDLRFQVMMEGDPPVSDPYSMPGTERIHQIRINPDRRPGKTPGNCLAVRQYFFSTVEGWGVDVDITGPDESWTYASPSFCTAANALKPGDYIVSLDYEIVGTGFQFIDVPIVAFGDRDDDGVPDPSDNCPDVPNPGQEDSDNNNVGDVCDPDDRDRDDDGVDDDADNCPDHFNPSQVDSDNDGLGDTCDPYPFDSDNDGVNDGVDNCPTVFNPTQDDTDGDGEGNECEIDIDGDGVPNTVDNCPLTPNADQLDSDFVPDGLGDACDPPDSDGDGVTNSEDNCPSVANPNQTDSNSDGQGDVCDLNDDTDADGLPDAFDNCPAAYNPFQQDSDNDGLGNACETDDTDGDGWADGVDNCPSAFNPGQFDEDQDGIGDICDQDHDPDGDGIPSFADNCDHNYNPGQQDANGDGIGDACDRFSDTDHDGLSDLEESELGTDPLIFTPVEPGINIYPDGQLTGTASAATSGQRIGVAISGPDSIDAVAVKVTDPAGSIVFADTLVPNSPVVFSFTPIAAGRWRIAADLYEDSMIVTTLELNLLVLPASAPTPKSGDHCKNDGWQTLHRRDGTLFKNQGACVSYVNTNR